MGVVKGINFEKYPKQGKWLGKRVEVCFAYNTNKLHRGNIIRDDYEEPGVGIIRLDNGRVLLTTECQYQILYHDADKVYSATDLEPDRQGIESRMFLSSKEMHLKSTMDDFVAWCGAELDEDNKWRLPNGEIVALNTWVSKSPCGEFFTDNQSSINPSKIIRSAKCVEGVLRRGKL